MKHPMKSICLLSILLLFSLACSFGLLGKDSDVPQPQQESPAAASNSEAPLIQEQSPTNEVVVGQPLRQWASAATASSEYGTTDWSAAQATGAPNAECGDDKRAWASATTGGQEWLELTYSTPVIPTEIKIHQSYNPSQIVEVDVIALDGAQHVVWTGQAAQMADCPYLMTIPLSNQYPSPVIGVRLVFDQSILGLDWNEIDAVELVGMP